VNFNNYFGRIYEARYLAGIAAGMKAKELGVPKSAMSPRWRIHG
jgi:basic membrane protein A